MPASQDLKTAGVLDALLAACVRLGNILAFKESDEGVARASLAGSVSPLIVISIVSVGRPRLVEHSTAAAPSWLVPPQRGPTTLLIIPLWTTTLMILLYIVL